jgi:type IV fimbrial biogenesis protein FimT
MKAPFRPRHAVRGLTIVETMCALAVLAVATGATLPKFQQLRDDSALAGAAARLEAEIQLARSESVLRGQPIRLTLGAATRGSCLMVHTGDADDCQCGDAQPAQCTGDAELLRASVIDARERAQWRANVGSILFDGDRGTSTPTATLRVQAPDGRALHAIVNLTGRVRTCAPGGRVGGYRAC